jgi:iron-sulfur cluster insertion protein
MHTVENSAIPPLSSATFGVTESAAARINHLKTIENNPNLRFRIVVKGGGCSGFQYEFILDKGSIADSDIVINKDGAEVIIDDVSIGIIGGSTLDYVEDLAQAGFEIKNPNATAKCGCGNSFSVAL